MTNEKITIKLETSDGYVRESSITNWQDITELFDWLCKAFGAIGYEAFAKALREGL